MKRPQEFRCMNCHKIISGYEASGCCDGCTYVDIKRIKRMIEVHEIVGGIDEIQEAR